MNSILDPVDAYIVQLETALSKLRKEHTGLLCKFNQLQAQSYAQSYLKARLDDLERRTPK